MATVTLKVEGSTVGVVERTITLTDLESYAFLQWAKFTFPKVTEIVNGKSVVRERTYEESVKAAIDAIVKRTVNDVNAFMVYKAKVDAEEAAKAAALQMR